MHDIYLASSWRNEYQPLVLKQMRNDGFSVYDFRNPHPDMQKGDHICIWDKIDPNWKDWTQTAFCDALETDEARDGFKVNADAMRDAKVCVLLLPSGRSAHLELGWMIGKGKTCFVYIAAGEKVEPELMYLLGAEVFTDYGALRVQLRSVLGGD